MSYALGALKYFFKAFRYPVNYWIFGGTLLWFLDILNLIGADSVEDFAVAYVLMTYGIPSSVGDAVLQLAVGAGAATILWYIGIKRWLNSGRPRRRGRPRQLRARRPRGRRRSSMRLR